MDPITMSLLLSSLVPAVGNLLSGLSPANMAKRKELKADVKRMREGKLGISDASKNQAVAQALEQAQAQGDAQKAELERQGSRNSGAFERAIQRQSSINPAIAASAMNQMNQQSSQLAESRKQSILNRLGEQASVNRAMFADTAKAIQSGVTPAIQEGLTGDMDWEALLKYLNANKAAKETT